MTDPERISQRGAGLAAQLLRAGAVEQPDAAGLQQTLAALGVASAVLTTSSGVSAAASAKLSGALSAGAATSGATTHVVSAALLAKWIGVGVVGGVGLAGAAAVATHPSRPAPVISNPAKPAPPSARGRAPVRPSASTAPPMVAAPPTEQPGAPALAPAPRSSVVSPREPAPELDVGAPLAAEVAYVDRARALLGGGHAEQGLALLERYEREFPQARLLPEVLFLEMEANERIGRASEVRRAAQRLVDGFPKSPHATRARTRLGE
jgi:hypothetical protein